jgi:putative N6-adenine-specific DNA methylase
MNKIKLIATCSMGIEKVVANELETLGYTDRKVENGRVEFTAELKDIPRCNLWLRSADRLLLKIGEFKATTFDELFENTKTLPWGEFIEKNASFPVSHASSVKSILFSKSDCQSIVKKAVVESLKKHHKVTKLPEITASYPIRVSILKDQVTLTLDTSGTGLHKRGYRVSTAIAPLRETLAAAMILLTRWKGEDRVFLDPMCGSGTLLIEAAMIAKNIAPGRNRTFISKDWTCISKSAWQEAQEEANELINNEKHTILGSDIDWHNIKAANENINKAGIKDIHVQKLPLSEIGSKHRNGIIVTNPPYGERLNDKLDAEKLYKEMGEVFKDKFPEWSYYILTSHVSFEAHFDKKASKKRKLYNGGIQCWYYQYYGTNFSKKRRRE